MHWNNYSLYELPMPTTASNFEVILSELKNVEEEQCCSGLTLCSQRFSHHLPRVFASHEITADGELCLYQFLIDRSRGRQVAQSVETRGSKPALDTWWWGRIQPYQPYPKGAAPAASALLAEW